MNQYLIPTICCLAFVLLSMRIFKSFKFKNIKDKTYNTVCRILALILSYVAVILSWWSFNVPSDLKQTFLFSCVLYILQEVIDLDLLARIIKKKAGLE